MGERYVITLNGQFLMSIRETNYDASFSLNDAIWFSRKEVKIFYDFLDRKYGSFTDIKICEIITSVKEVEL